MVKIKIDLPDTFPFTTLIPVRITDVNYGGHVGNDSILSMIHEARAQFLAMDGFSEVNFGGAALILRDVVIQFKKELFYGDKLRVSVAVTHLTGAAFTLLYKMEKETNDQRFLAVTACTGMVCFDYSLKKIIPLPEAVNAKWQSRYSSSLPPAV